MAKYCCDRHCDPAWWISSMLGRLTAGGIVLPEPPCPRREIAARLAAKMRELTQVRPETITYDQMGSPFTHTIVSPLEPTESRRIKWEIEELEKELLQYADIEEADWRPSELIAEDQYL